MLQTKTWGSFTVATFWGCTNSTAPSWLSLTPASLMSIPKLLFYCCWTTTTVNKATLAKMKQVALRSLLSDSVCCVKGLTQQSTRAVSANLESMKLPNSLLSMAIIFSKDKSVILEAWDCMDQICLSQTNMVYWCNWCIYYDNFQVWQTWKYEGICLAVLSARAAGLGI